MNAIPIIKGIEEFFAAVRKDSSAWGSNQPKWFRGEPKRNTALVPTLYRGGLAPHENELLQMFRTRGPGYHDVVPSRDHTDQWLFLARHAGLPTRLLDWSEAALIGLYFALKEDSPVIWMLNPLELNALSYGGPVREFPLVWHDPDPICHRVHNPAFENLRGAWENDGPGVPLPIAIYPTYVHPLLRRSCFTIHGKNKSGLDTLVSPSILRRYVVDPASRQPMINELTLLGITHSVVSPNLDGLAAELKARFLKPSATTKIAHPAPLRRDARGRDDRVREELATGAGPMTNHHKETAPLPALVWAVVFTILLVAAVAIFVLVLIR